MSTIRVVNIQHSDATEPNIVLNADGTATFVSGITISGGTNLTVSGTAEFASGTVSAPGITFIDDNNTGIYSPGADQVAVATNGTERLAIEADGDVRIGSSANYGWIRGWDSTTGNMIIGADQSATGTGGSALIFRNRGSERLRIDSSGRLLVGTSTSRIVEDLQGNGPQGLIQIEAANSDAIMSIISAGTADAGRAGTLSLGRHRNSTVGGTPTVVQSGDTLGAICFAGGDGTDMRTKGASIACQVDSTPGANDMPGRLVFSTTADGASIPTERMRIDSSGNVGIGGSPSSFSNQKSFSLFAGSSTVARFDFYNSDGSTREAEILSYSGNNESLRFGGITNRDMTFHTNNTERMRILAAGGLTFNGDTAAANALDDYEEGTFTPTIVSGADDGSGGTVPFSIQAGRYTKVGNKVFVDIYIRFATGAASDGVHARIGNLPFAISNLSYGTVGAANLTRGGGTSSYHDTTNDITTLYGSANTVTVYLYKNGGETFLFGGSNNTNLAGGYWIGYFTYNTDA